MTAQPCFLIHLFHKHPKIYFCLFSAVLYHIMILWNMLSTCSDNDTGNIQTSRHFARPYYFAVFSFPTILNIYRKISQLFLQFSSIPAVLWLLFTASLLIVSSLIPLPPPLLIQDPQFFFSDSGVYHKSITPHYTENRNRIPTSLQTTYFPH